MVRGMKNDPNEEYIIYPLSAVKLHCFVFSLYKLFSGLSIHPNRGGTLMMELATQAATIMSKTRVIVRF